MTRTGLCSSGNNPGERRGAGRILAYHAFAATLWLLLLAGCASTAPQITSEAQPELVASAWADLSDLPEVDVLLTLNNELLQRHMRDVLQSLGEQQEAARFREIRFDFGLQSIAVEIGVTIQSPDGEELMATLLGDILLAVSGERLTWMPRFHRLEPKTPQPGEAGIEGIDQIIAEQLGALNARVTDTAMVQRLTTIGLASMPLGEIEFSIALPSFQGASGTARYELPRAFAVAGTALLIEETQTRVALDLEFLPGLSRCQTELRVTRSVFARNVVAREPRQILRQTESGAGETVYFSELSGTRKPAVILHYWLADGRIVEVFELPVEPSERWRTWSSIPIDDQLARNWQVIVADRESGCVLDSGLLRAGAPRSQVPSAVPGTNGGFADYVQAFNHRMADFPVQKQTPGIATIDMPREFFKEAMNIALGSRQFAVRVAVPATKPAAYSGTLARLPYESLDCAATNCQAPRACQAELERCVRQTDTRDCRSCSLRNPLNNRCISESIDPVCEQLRTGRNRHYEAQWASCRDEEEGRQRSCERRNRRELKTCEAESRAMEAACETRRTHLANWPDQKPLADVQVNVATQGELSVIFDNVRLLGDFERLSANLSIDANLRLDGDMRLMPRPSAGPMTDCLQAWSGPVSATVTRPISSRRRLATIEVKQSELTAIWAEVEFQAATNRSPMLAAVGDPEDSPGGCGRGLAVEQILDALSGEASTLLSGALPLPVQLKPSRIAFFPVRAQIGESTISAAPVLTQGFVRYQLSSN